MAAIAPPLDVLLQASMAGRPALRACCLDARDSLLAGLAKERLTPETAQPLVEELGRWAGTDEAPAAEIAGVCAIATTLAAGCLGPQVLRPLLDAGRRLLPAHATLDLQAVVVLAEADLLEAGYDMAAYAEVIAEALELLPETSSAASELLLRAALRMAMHGELGRLGAVFDLPVADLTSGDRRRQTDAINAIPQELLVACFCDAVEAGRTAEADGLRQRLIDESAWTVDEDMLLHSTMADDELLGPYARLLDLQIGWQLGDTTAIDLHDDGLLRPLAALRERDARAVEACLASSDLRQQQLDAAAAFANTPLRLALALGDLAQARALLAHRQELGWQHWLDDLALARIALANGQQSEARQRFARCRQQATSYRASDRLDWELALAWDLRPIDIADLGQAASDTPSTNTNALTGDLALADQLSGLPDGTGSVAARFIGDSVAAGRCRQLVADIECYALAQDEDAEHPWPSLCLAGPSGSGRRLLAELAVRAEHLGEDKLLAWDAATCDPALITDVLLGEGPQLGLLERAAGGCLLIANADHLPAALLGLVAGIIATRRYQDRAGVERPCDARLLLTVDPDQLADADRATIDHLRMAWFSVPGLSDRIDDLRDLVNFRLRDHHDRRLELAPATWSALAAAAWPGQVRQLWAVVDQLQRCRGRDDYLAIEPDELPTGWAD